MFFSYPRSGLLAAVLFLAAADAPAENYRAAILDEPSLPVVGQATPVAAFEQASRDAGIELHRLDAAALADAKTFNADAYELLVVPVGASFPAAARDALLAFLQRGGGLLCTGGYAFDQLWEGNAGQWTSCHEAWLRKRDLARDPKIFQTPNGGFENGTEDWTFTDAAACTVVREQGASGQCCARVDSASAAHGPAWLQDLSVKPGERYLIGAAMKTRDIRGPGFGYMAVYQYDEQGALVQFVDFAQVHQSEEWKRYEAEIEIAPNTAKTAFHAGFYLASGTCWFDQLTCAPLPREPRINGHYGTPEDGLRVEPLQLMLFNPDQPIHGAALVPAATALLPRGWRSEGAVEGYEATAQLGHAARWAPLVDIQDAWGRFAGSAGALVHHYAGAFAGSSWALFGVNNRDIFAGEPGAALLKEVLQRLKTGAFIQSLQSEYALYEPGEQVKATLAVRNASRVPRELQVEFRIHGGAVQGDAPALLSELRVMTVPAQSTQEVPMAWSLPQETAGLVHIEALLRSGELLVDRESTGCCVRDTGARARGTGIRYADNSFVLTPPGESPRRVCLFGTDTYANMFFSKTQSPWTWHHDLEMMRDNGLDLFENLQYAPGDYQFNERQWRQLDAMIQLSQEAGLTYMAGLLVGQNVAVSDEELGAQAEMCRQFARRYHEVPGLIYYLNGDFRLDVKDLPDLRRLWNAFLSTRYTDDAGLRKAWSSTPPEGPLGDLPVSDHAAGAWYEVRARDVAEFKSVLMRRWIEALCTAIRGEDAVHPITSEYYQRSYNGVDPRWSIGSMDAANIGYFDAPQQDVAGLMATIKRNDLRWAGKSINIGEFGVKTHDAWSGEQGGKTYHLQRSEEEAESLFWWLGHTALAMGVTKIQNWCWSDDPDWVFPWGTAWVNPLRAKPVLKLYRNLRVLADRLEPAYRPAEVVLILPENWRMGAPEALEHSVLSNAVECLLACNVPFDVINESEIARLVPKPPRAAVMPCAYALPDASVDALMRLADAGCHVYLSGDPSIAPTGQREPERLERLAGVRFDTERAHASGMPVPVVTPSNALAIENPCGLPLYRRNSGTGDITWSPEPWESFSGRDLFVKEAALTTDPASNYYLSLLPACGVAAPFQVTAPARRLARHGHAERCEPAHYALSTDRACGRNCGTGGRHGRKSPIRDAVRGPGDDPAGPAGRAPVRDGQPCAVRPWPTRRGRRGRVDGDQP